MAINALVVLALSVRCALGAQIVRHDNAIAEINSKGSISVVTEDKHAEEEDGKVRTHASQRASMSVSDVGEVEDESSRMAQCMGGDENDDLGTNLAQLLICQTLMNQELKKEKSMMDDDMMKMLKMNTEKVKAVVEAQQAKKHKAKGTAMDAGVMKDHAMHDMADAEEDQEDMADATGAEKADAMKAQADKYAMDAKTSENEIEAGGPTEVHPMSDRGENPTNDHAMGDVAMDTAMGDVAAEKSEEAQQEAKGTATEAMNSEDEEEMREEEMSKEEETSKEEEGTAEDPDAMESDADARADGDDKDAVYGDDKDVVPVQGDTP